jgi:hypothetical protein
MKIIIRELFNLVKNFLGGYSYIRDSGKLVKFSRE